MLLLLLLVASTLRLSPGGLAGGVGLQLTGDYYIAGLFPLHNADTVVSSQPSLGDCKE